MICYYAHQGWMESGWSAESIVDSVDLYYEGDTDFLYESLPDVSNCCRNPGGIFATASDILEMREKRRLAEEAKKKDQ